LSATLTPLASPYRARPPKPLSTLVVPVFAVPRPLLAVLSLLVIVPIGLHLFLWSRLVSVRCERGAAPQISCAIDETSLALSSVSRQSATGAVSAALRGETWRYRGDAWIVLIGRSGETRLTSGFNGDKTGQRAAATALTTFLQNPNAHAVTVSFGSRWRAAWIFGVIYAVMLLIGYPLLGQRLRVTADRERDALDFHRRVWPLPGTRSTVMLHRLLRFEIATLPKGRFRLVAVLANQQAHPLSWPLGTGTVLERAAASLNTWAEAERAGYRERSQSIEEDKPS
jgi:hypothetical protein